MARDRNDREITVRVGCFRVTCYAEGGQSVEVFSKQGDWLLAHEDEHDAPDAREALRIADECRHLVIPPVHHA